MGTTSLDHTLMCECGNKLCKDAMEFQVWAGSPQVELITSNDDKTVSIVLRLDGLTQLMEACQKALEFYAEQQ